jgi:hypothetical protein
VSLVSDEPTKLAASFVDDRLSDNGLAPQFQRQLQSWELGPCFPAPSRLAKGQPPRHASGNALVSADKAELPVRASD